MKSMAMKEAIVALNDLVKRGVIREYAVGGGTAALAYLEPVLTFDVDVFVVFSDSDRFDVLTPIYTVLKDEYGAVFDQAHPETITVCGVAIQFLEAKVGLLRDACENATVIDYDGVPVRFFSAEYLIAICLDVGRPKDRQRVGMFQSAKAYDETRLNTILSKYSLTQKWNEWIA